VAQLLQSRHCPQALFINESARSPQIDEIRGMATKRGIKVQALSSPAFAARFGADSQGVCAQMADFPYTDLGELLQRLANQDQISLLALNHLEDPRNLGAIVRTAEIAGLDGILLPKDRAAGMTDWAIRTSQGAAFFVPVCRVINIGETLRKLKEKQFWTVGLSEHAPQRYDQYKYAAKTVIVAGGEDEGLGKVVADTCDDLISIPMFGKTPSLNVSVSVGVIIYDMLRQRGFPR
jgi:23S rRNA (guanosine2251-2'-O)-methyltransferase